MKEEFIEIGDKEYLVQIAISENDKRKGLQNVNDLPDDEGMLFIFDKPEKVEFWMKDTLIPLDIIFIGKDKKVISKYTGEPKSEDLVREDNVNYVLEVNANSKIKEGDLLKFDIIDDTKEMHVIGSDGKVQMVLESGERIFSRKHTKTLIKMAKRADKYKTDKYYKALGKKVFSYINKQDTQDPEFVEK